jgi:hypothetical protein
MMKWCYEPMAMGAAVDLLLRFALLFRFYNANSGNTLTHIHTLHTHFITLLLYYIHIRYMHVLLYIAIHMIDIT